MTRFNKFFLTILFLATSILTYGQQNTVLSLQQCLDIAIKNNLQVKQSGLTMEADRINFLQAKENLIPALSGSVSRGLTQGRGLSPVTNTYVNQSLTSDNYGLSANVTLFNGLSYQNAIKQASLAYQAGKMDLQAAKDVVTINVITNYLMVLDAEEQLSQTQSQLAVAQQQVDRANVLEKEGANKAASDIYDFKGQLAGSQVAATSAQNNVNAAKLSLFQLLNIPYDANAQLQPLSAEDLIGQHDADPNQVYATALQQLAQVKSATLKRQSAEKQVKVLQGQLFPTLSLSGGISTNYSSAGTKTTFIDSTTAGVPGLFVNTPTGKESISATTANYSTDKIGYTDQFKNNYGTYALLSLNIPIFTNHYRKNQVALGKISLQNAQYVEDNTKIMLRQNVEQAYSNMIAAYNKYRALTEQVNAYTESFRISKIRYDSGVLTSVDYIISKNQLDAANLNLISAHFDYFIYSKILDYYQGKVSASQ